MYSILVNKNIITILPMKSSFHFSIKMNEYVKMSDELLKLNYSHYSPYIKSNIISYYDGILLHLWFYEEEIDSFFIIPESYLIFILTKEKYNNISLIVQDKIFIIKDNHLLSSFISTNENILKLSMDEHGISDFKTIDKDLKQESLDVLRFSELLKWTNPLINLKNFMISSIEMLSYPISVLFALVLVMNIVHENILTSNIQELENKYTKIKVLNDEVRLELTKKKMIRKQWKSFLENELIYPDVLVVLEGLVKKVPKKEATIKHLSIINGIINITVESNKNPIFMLNKFIDVELVKNVSIKRSFKPKKKKRIVVYEMDLIPLGNQDEL